MILLTCRREKKKKLENTELKTPLSAQSKRAHGHIMLHLNKLKESDSHPKKNKRTKEEQKTEEKNKQTKQASLKN